MTGIKFVNLHWRKNSIIWLKIDNKEEEIIKDREEVEVVEVVEVNKVSIDNNE